MFRVSARLDYIRLEDEQGEIVYWDKQEWIDDPDLVITIANAIIYGNALGGAAVRELIERRNRNGS